MLLLIAVIATLWVIGWATGLHENFTTAQLRQTIVESGGIGIAVFIALFCLGQVLQLPGNAFIAAAAFSWGWWQGALVSVVAATLGACVSFLVARSVGGDVRAVQKPLLQRILAPLRDAPIRTMIVARLLFMTAPPLSPALALSGVRHRDHAAATLVGMTPAIFFSSYLWAFGFAALGL